MKTLSRKAMDDARLMLEKLRARVVQYEAIMAGGDVPCSRCKKPKPASAFYNPVANRRCIDCAREVALAAYHRNKALAKL